MTDIEGVIDAIPKRKAEDLIQVIRSGIHRKKTREEFPESNNSHVKSISFQSSIADELTKLVKLKEQGILNDEEFARLKNDVLEKNR